MDELVQIEVMYDFERTTKRTKRYSEGACKVNGEDRIGPVSGVLYLQKWALDDAFGSEHPNRIIVTIKAG